ncbi:MAG: DUF433 domain-containing protein [Planctomycetes bacterium]|nr:DUF433 domain-containing protein [Planctomycetota bacterium]
MEPLICIDPATALGKAVVTGTRITVEHILERLGAGEGMEQLLAAHPRLTKEAIHAALSYAAKALNSDVVYPTGGTAA